MEAVEVSRRLYELLARHGRGDPPRMRAWNGEEWGPAEGPTVVLRHPGALAAFHGLHSDLAVAEAYVFDDVDIEGDIVALLRFGSGLLDMDRLTALRALRLAWSLRADRRRHDARRPTMSGRLHSIGRDKKAVTHHYDTSNDFFSLFLDPHMVYSCAHFLDPAEPLERAQLRKLDLICRKLELAPGQRFLDVGCGWGALVIHAAAEYGVEAVGITVSGEQADEARKRVAAAGLADLVTIVETDYRRIDGSFHAIASVGMVEHVGIQKLPTYFKHLRSLLVPGGQLLNHGIVTRSLRKPDRKSFIRTYVFPDGVLTRVDEVVRAAERAGFELRDTESLRLSYARTLEHWVANLEAHADEARELVGEDRYRIWRLYMAGSAVAFERGDISVHQLLLSDPARPWPFGRRRLLAADDS